MHWSVWASSISRPTRRRRADARSGCFTPCRIDWSRSWRSKRSTPVEAANLFLRDVYIPEYNARFAVAAAQEGTAFVAIPGVDLAEILCVQEERQVGNDNCVSFNRLKLQIPESPLRAHFVKTRVKVRQYPDGTHAIFYGPRCLGRHLKGVLIHEKQAASIRHVCRWNVEQAP